MLENSTENLENAMLKHKTRRCLNSTVTFNDIQFNFQF